MPIYEYACNKCSHAFEHLAKSVSAPPPPCPECGSKKTVKQLSVFSASVASSKKPCFEGNCPSAARCSAGGCPSGGCPAV